MIAGAVLVGVAAPNLDRLQYVKLSRALVKEVRQELSVQTLLCGLCTIAHTMGMNVIAEGIAHNDEATLLFELGFDGVAGAAVTQGGKPTP